MHVALLASARFLEEELPMWRSLLVGLVAEAVRITALLPDTPGLRAEPELLPPAGERLWWRDSGWGYLRRARLLELAETLQPQAPEVLHIFSGELWQPGLALAQRLHCPAVLYTGSQTDLAYAARLNAVEGGLIAFAGATVPLVKALGQQVGARAMVAYVPPGVYSGTYPGENGEKSEGNADRNPGTMQGVDASALPTSPLSVFPPGEEEKSAGGFPGRSPGTFSDAPPGKLPRAIPGVSGVPGVEKVWCVTVAAGETMDAWLESALRALAELHRAGRRIQVFLDSPVEDPHALWQLLHRLELTACASIIPRRQPGGRREPLLGADALIHPQPLHRARGLLLAAMARGLPLLAAADPMVDYLIEDQTAWLVHSPETHAWRMVLERLMNDPAAGAALGQAAQAYVREQRTVSAQVQRLLDLYHQLTARPLPFSTGALKH